MSAAFDPIELEILWNRLASIADEQAAALIRSAFSTLLRETEDISCGIFDARGNMIVQSAIGTPGHINTMAIGVRHFLRKYPPARLAPGDVLISNDPWLISGHKHDFTVVTPFFLDERLTGWTANTCHVADIGGRVFSADAPTVFEEGLLIPILKLYRRGEPNEDLFTLLEENVRVPREVLGDIGAQVASNEVGNRKVVAYLREKGLDSLETLSDAIIENTEAATRRAVAKVPPGEYAHEIHMDGFEEPLVIRIAIRIEGDQLTADYAGTDPESPRGINSVMNYTEAYTTYALKCALCPEIPNNEGGIRPFRVIAPEGCLVNTKHPAPVAARHLTGHLLPFAVFGALSQVIPDQVVSDGSLSVTLQFDGKRPGGDRFLSTFFNAGGMGARPDRDGLTATSFPNNLSNTPIEVIESEAPFRFLQKELLTDSGGAGARRGGLAQVMRLQTLGAEPVTISAMFERTRFAAQGFQGGGPGSLLEVELEGKGPLPAKRKTSLPPGSILRVRLAGGGGFGPPAERDPESVLDDIRKGFVSAEAARRDYRVAVDPDTLRIDREATEGLRKNPESAGG